MAGKLKGPEAGKGKEEDGIKVCLVSRTPNADPLYPMRSAPCPLPYMKLQLKANRRISNIECRRMESLRSPLF